jgi:hypothetical protein
MRLAKTYVPRPRTTRPALCSPLWILVVLAALLLGVATPASAERQSFRHQHARLKNWRMLSGQSYLDQVHFTPTRKCQLAGACLCPLDPGHREEMSFGLFRAMLERIAPLVHPNHTLLTLTGFGEILRHSNPIALIKEAQRWANVSFHTNALALNAARIGDLLTVNPRRLGSAKAVTEVRGHAIPSFREQVVFGLKAAPGLEHRFGEAGARQLEQRAAGNVIAFMRAVDNLPDHQRRQLWRDRVEITTLYGHIPRLEEAVREYGFNPDTGSKVIATPLHSWSGQVDAAPVDEQPLMPCNRFPARVQVGVKGQVSSCCRDYTLTGMPIGDLRRQTMAEILTSESYLRLLDLANSGLLHRHPFCKDCELNDAPDEPRPNEPLVSARSL